jgi:hypothetical protein
LHLHGSANGGNGGKDFFWETCFVFGLLLNACMFLVGGCFSVALFGGLLLCVYDMWLGLWLGLSAGPGGGFCLPFVCMEKFLLELVVV